MRGGSASSPKWKIFGFILQQIDCLTLELCWFVWFPQPRPVTWRRSTWTRRLSAGSTTKTAWPWRSCPTESASSLPTPSSWRRWSRYLMSWGHSAFRASSQPLEQSVSNLPSSLVANLRRRCSTWKMASSGSAGSEWSVVASQFQNYPGRGATQQKTSPVPTRPRGSTPEKTPLRLEAGTNSVFWPNVLQNDVWC